MAILGTALDDARSSLSSRIQSMEETHDMTIDSIRQQLSQTVRKKETAILFLVDLYCVTFGKPMCRAC